MPLGSRSSTADRRFKPMPLPPIGQGEPPLRVIPGGRTADDLGDDGYGYDANRYERDMADESYATRYPAPASYREDDEEDDGRAPVRKRRSVLGRVALKAIVVLTVMVGAGALYLASRDVVGTEAVADTVASTAPVATLATAPAPMPAPVASTPALPVPSVPALVILIRNAMVSLQQANETGNYSVLRELAAPELQIAASTAVLADAFAPLRTRDINLSAITVVDPMLSRPPVVDGKGVLQLNGYFDAADTKVDFDIAFQFIEGRWRLAALVAQPAEPVGKVDAAGRVPSGKPEVPDAATIVTLMRTTVIALNQANMTGNYSVLRDLGAPGFQDANSFAKLADIFADLRGRQLDLGPVAVIDPKLFKPAAIDERGMLRLTGFFTSQPEQVNFDLAFQRIDGRWKLFGLGVNTTREEPAPIAAAPSPNTPAAEAAPAQVAAPQPRTAPMGTPPIPRLRPVVQQEQG